VVDVNAVDYAGITADQDYADYLTKLMESTPDTLPKAEQLAFWMNVYNALCISLIVEHEKKNEALESINNLSGDSSGPVWDLPAGNVGGTMVSLNEVEHEKLRKTWAQAAVHACIVCASASCPNLRQEAFVGSRVKEQMDDQMKDWMKNPSKGLLLEGNRLELSRIFLWFSDDFGGTKGIQSWLPQYIQDKSIAEKVAKGKSTVRYFEYDWQINRAK
jgi:hypothetical protein